MFPQVDNGANVFETQTFIGGGAPGVQTAASPTQIWHKPLGCRFVGFFVVGAGAGGGGGLSNSAGTARGGGGGGQAGSIVRAIFLADMIPDTLYLYVPAGGIGSSGSTVNGGVGGRVYVSCVPNSIAAGALLLISGAADAGGGVAGTDIAGGTGGAGGTVAANTTAYLSPMALSWVALVGISGSNGGAHTGAAGSNRSTDQFTSGGAGGGGTTSADFAGGNQSAGVMTASIAGGLASSPDGNGGIAVLKPWTTTGGSGGAALNSASGGRGGNGAPGSGGGGGGAGTTGGGGGDGGPAVCIITAF